jgi:hypothetical protein
MNITGIDSPANSRIAVTMSCDPATITSGDEASSLRAAEPLPKP